MSIDIDMQSARFTVDPQGAALAFVAATKFAAFHLTQGFTRADDPDLAVNVTKAFLFSASVKISVDNIQEANDVLNGNWSFNFVQVAKQSQMDFLWEGRTRFEGEVEMIVARPPAWPQTSLISLDSLPSRTPFVQSAKHVGLRKRNQQGQRIELEVSHTMGDHPFVRVLLKYPNRTTRTDNFLQQVEIDEEYTSVFVARNPAQTMIPLGHIKWRIVGNGTLKWRNGNPFAILRSGQVKFELPVLGGPEAPSIAAIVTNPRPPFSTDVVIGAIKKAALEKLNTTFSPRRTRLLVPKDFFT
jgi:hypothetical protein